MISSKQLSAQESDITQELDLHEVIAEQLGGGDDDLRHSDGVEDVWRQVHGFK